jgi:PAS domain S-box-containing protein
MTSGKSPDQNGSFAKFTRSSDPASLEGGRAGQRAAAQVLPGLPVFSSRVAYELSGPRPRPGQTEGDCLTRLSERRTQTRLLGEAADHAPTAFLVVDESGSVVAVNRYSCEALGYERKELLDLSVDDLGVSSGVEDLVREKGIGIIPLRHRDGRTVLVRYEARVVEAASLRILVLVAHVLRVLPESATPQEAAARAPRPRDGSTLSRRELEILQLMADGFDNEEISGQLSISLETVKSHVRGVLRKLSARSRTQAAAVGLRRGLVD